MIQFKRDRDLVKIFEHFGDQNQQLKLHEELGELIDEIDPSTSLSSKFAEEMADVLIMCMQFYYSSDLFKYTVDKYINYKIDRTLGKIKI